MRGTCKTHGRRTTSQNPSRFISGLATKKRTANAFTVHTPTKHVTDLRGNKYRWPTGKTLQQTERTGRKQFGYPRSTMTKKKTNRFADWTNSPETPFGRIVEKQFTGNLRLRYRRRHQRGHMGRLSTTTGTAPIATAAN